MAYHQPIDELTATVTPRGPGPRVVLGEAEPDGWLRFVLEGEGLDIVGHATTDDEVARVLDGVVPDVIVLDAGISATAALDARERADAAAIVVVWPSGVASVLAEERVEPDRVVEDLGDAVRSAAARANTSTIDGEVSLREPVEPSSDDEPVATPTGKRRTPALPVALATWIVYLTFVAAIASAVPKAFEPPRPGGMREARPTVSPSDRTDTAPVVTGAPATEGSGEMGSRGRNGRGPDTGATSEEVSDDGKAGGGRRTGSGGQLQGNASGNGGQGQGDQGDGNGGQGQGGGAPEDPGSQGQGGRPEDPGSQGQGNQGGKGHGKGSDEVVEVDPAGTRPGSDRRPEGTSVARSVDP